MKNIPPGVTLFPDPPPLRDENNVFEMELPELRQRLDRHSMSPATGGMVSASLTYLLRDRHHLDELTETDYARLAVFFIEAHQQSIAMSLGLARKQMPMTVKVEKGDFP